jgi:hypothetical protein
VHFFLLLLILLFKAGGNILPAVLALFKLSRMTIPLVHAIGAQAGNLFGR